MAEETGSPVSAVVDNRTGLPDIQILDAVRAQFVETAALHFGTPTNFQLYSTSNGSILSREPFRTPKDVFEEIKIARMVADTDDDIQSVVGQSLATCYGSGMENLHEDERTLALFNEAAKIMNLDMVFKEIHREYLIAGSVTTVQLPMRKRVTVNVGDSGREFATQMVVPKVSTLPAENVRVLSNDMFGDGELAYLPTNVKLADWLKRFFDSSISQAMKSKMASEQPILAAIFTEAVKVKWDEDEWMGGETVYKLNKRLVHRTSMPKGASPYARPLLTSNFALLEAKRLLNIMDYALLQGGTNYIVVAKVGSDKQLARQPEVDNLALQVANAGRSGVLVGDHRIDIEIITPDLTELLNPAKRKLLGRKMAMGLLRIPEQVTNDAGGEGARQEMEFTQRTLTSDRLDVKRHVGSNVYDEVVARNRSLFPKGAPAVWFPRIILSGVKDFQAAITAARDRGDIPRKYAVEALGYPYAAAVAQRKRELENGDDEVMVPGHTPFDGQGPGDGGQGRPPGSSSNNGRPGSAAPPPDPAQRQRQRLIPRQRGEAIHGHWDEQAQTMVRIGELTAEILTQNPGHEIGRLQPVERDGALGDLPVTRGPLTVVPVNPGHEVAVDTLKVVRISSSLGLVVGQTVGGSIVAKAVSTREPEFTAEGALDRAVRWGFISGTEDPPPVAEDAVASLAALASQVDAEAFGAFVKALLTDAIAEAVARVQQPPAA